MPLGPSFPELASLDLFVSVVELGSVSRAAAAHGVAQPSASSRLKHLERQLGLTLLERSPSGSVPTDAGVVVAGWAEAILRSAHALKAGLSAFQAEQAGRLRIAASFTIAEYLLPQWLGRFARVEEPCLSRHWPLLPWSPAKPDQEPARRSKPHLRHWTLVRQRRFLN